MILATESLSLFTGSRCTGLLLKFVDFVFEKSFRTTQNGTQSGKYNKIKLSKTTFKAWKQAIKQR